MHNLCYISINILCYNNILCCKSVNILLISFWYLTVMEESMWKWWFYWSWGWENGLFWGHNMSTYHLSRSCSSASHHYSQKDQYYHPHTPFFKVPHHPLQSTIPPSSKYHTTLFKVPHHPLQSTIPPSSEYHSTFFKVHTTVFKVPYHPHHFSLKDQ